MKCPHCITEIHVEEKFIHIGKDKDGDWGVSTAVCPACKKVIVKFGPVHTQGTLSSNIKKILNLKNPRLVRPKVVCRPPPPKEVPEELAKDYLEACLVIDDSPQASAALSRRCLQGLLRSKAAVKRSSLADEIQQVLDGEGLPTYLRKAIDAIRNIGNFAAHPTKSNSTGLIQEVESGEAEWNLDVLGSLFDFYYVQPEGLKEKRDRLNRKLKDTGKPPMK